MKKLIAMDCDGTIVDHTFVLKPELIEVAHKLVDAGHELVLATGRPTVLTVPVQKDLGVPEGNLAVCSNGAITISYAPDTSSGYNIVSKASFSPKEFLLIVMEHMPDAFVGVEPIGESHFLVNRNVEDHKLGADQEVVPFEQLYAKDVSRVIIYDPDGKTREFADKIEELGLEQISYAIGWNEWLDIAPYNISKASALEPVRKRLNIPHENTYAFGDGMNDITMLEWAAIGVALKNSFSETKAVAQYIAGDVSKEGIVPFLYKILRDEV
ncbi:MAG: HAD family hydrolase [Bifidobacteriaceae bacterium]|jgi:Cof subfamily protein (haloacid dehalogenase superfamily)|nr:HAD family hydrolase [Bifidobacteriaceae bacterium]